MEKVLIEKCLNNLPNKFELSVLAMNRAKDILLGSKTDVETTKFTKKSINKALKEIEENMLDIDALKDRIRKSLINNDIFLKDSSKYDEDSEQGDDNDLDTDIEEDIDYDFENDIDDEDEMMDEDVENFENN